MVKTVCMIYYNVVLQCPSGDPTLYLVCYIPEREREKVIIYSELAKEFNELKRIGRNLISF